MDKVSWVTCPKCSREYYLERSSYAGRPDAECECPFCTHVFVARDGKPRPPLPVEATGMW